MTQANEIQQNDSNRIIVHDNGQFADFLDTGRYEQLSRLAVRLAGSQLIPDHFRNKPGDCFLAASMAMRMGIDPMLLMQNIYVVHGKPGMQAQLAIALVNSSGLFTDPLSYEIEGENPFDASYRVRAYAKRKSTDSMVYGPWVDWKVVKAERWDGKEGSKWKTMPGLMFMYRAASWFGRTMCPESLMGMQTVEEIEDVVHVKHVDSIPVSAKAQAIADKYRKPESKPEIGGATDQGDDPSPRQTNGSGIPTAEAEPAQDAPPLNVPVTESGAENSGTNSAPVRSTAMTHWEQLLAALEEWAGECGWKDMAKVHATAVKVLTPKSAKNPNAATKEECAKILQVAADRAGFWSFLNIEEAASK